MQLYRHALKTCLDWSGSRQQWYARDNREAADRLLTHGEQLLQEWRHPDPILPPYYVGGTAFSRNPPMPKEVRSRSSNLQAARLNSPSRLPIMLESRRIKIVLDFGREGAAH
eukprot:gene15156-biopygen1980